MSTSSPFLAALRGENRGRPPIWLMRQAGRYMPQYQKIRQQYTTERMFRTPELITQITRLPLDLLGVDALILYSDILILLDAFHIPWHLEEGIGPVIDKPIQSEADVHALTLHPLEETLPFVGQSIQELKREPIPLLGFAGAPFTLASYLIEGKPTKQLTQTRKMVWERPELMHKLLQKLTQGVIAHLRYQIAAGVDAVQLFESWGYWLGGKTFDEFSLTYLQQIVSAIHEVPVITFCRQQAPTSLGTPLSLDWNFSLPEIRKSHPTLPLQGNLDPSCLYGSRETITREITLLMESMRGDPAFIVNLGHGVLPDTPLENAQHLVEACKDGLLNV